jgi:hypothetical protein
MRLSENVKLIVYVPQSHADQVRQAIGDAGSGVIGNYSHCSFTTQGVGRFKPLKGANPSIGEVGKLEEVIEEKIETLLHKDLVPKVLDAIKEVHPYEEIAYDLLPLYEL